MKISGQLLHRILKYIFIIILASIVGTVLLWLSFCIPDALITKHIDDDKQWFSEWESGTDFIDNVKGTYLNYYSEATMLNIASCTAGSGSALERAMACYQYIDEDEFNGFKEYCNSGKYDSIGCYDRYWQGYLVVLRPLLAMMRYKNILVLNLLFQIGLICGIAYFMYISTEKKYLIPLIFSVLFLTPITWAKSLYYSLIINILLIELLYLFICHAYKKKISELFFLYLGICVAFFDFLTFPVITLTFGLTIKIVIDDETEQLRFHYLINVVRDSVSWCIGYIGMWGMKWVLATLILRKNILGEAAGSILFRTSASDVTAAEHVSRWKALLVNIQIYNSFFYLIPLGILILFYLIAVIRKKISGKNAVDKISFDKCAALLLVVIIPIVWLAFKGNHSYIHCWMTYRELAGSILALSVLAASCV